MRAAVLISMYDDVGDVGDDTVSPVEDYKAGKGFVISAAGCACKLRRSRGGLVILQCVRMVSVERGWAGANLAAVRCCESAKSLE
jgi:hypothetical protein